MPRRNSNPADAQQQREREPYRLESSDSDDDVFPHVKHCQPDNLSSSPAVAEDEHRLVIEGARAPHEDSDVFLNAAAGANADRDVGMNIMDDSSDEFSPRQGPRTPPGEPEVRPRGPRTPPYEDLPAARGPRTPPGEPATSPGQFEYPRNGPKTPPGPPPGWSQNGPRTPPGEPIVHQSGPKTPPGSPPGWTQSSGPKTPPEPDVDLKRPSTLAEESDVRRSGPKTPPLDDADYNINVGFEEVSDGEVSSRPRVGPKTPPEEDYVPPSPVEIARAIENAAAVPPAQSQDEENVKEDEKRPVSPHTPPPRQSNETSPTQSQNASPKRRESSQVHQRKRHHDEKPNEPMEIPKELTFPALATQKCLSLLEFVERRGLTITDDELLQVVRDSIMLDQAMEDIVNKKEIMKKTVEEMTEYELESIRKIHSNLPRHMQDVLQFDGKTVHIAQERTAMPPMPFSSSPLMSLKYGQSFAHHMGMPPGMAHLAPPPMGLPPPPMGMQPPSFGGVGAPPFAMPPPLSLLGPPPFSIPPLIPPTPQSLAVSSRPTPQTPQRSSLPQPVEPERSLPQGLNPIAFSNAPPGLKLAPMPEYTRPPPSKKSAHQNPQMNRITNNLSSMLTNALKAQVSKSPFNSNPVAKKAVPSLMSINIPGIPKAGPSGPK